MIGTVLHRCPECGELSYDPRTGFCDTTDDILNCPYHAHWIRAHYEYRTCPQCSYCIHCRIRNRPVVWPHTHGKYSFTEPELALI